MGKAVKAANVRNLRDIMSKEQRQNRFNQKQDHKDGDDEGGTMLRGCRVHKDRKNPDPRQMRREWRQAAGSY